MITIVSVVILYYWRLYYCNIVLKYWLKMNVYLKLSVIFDICFGSSGFHSCIVITLEIFRNWACRTSVSHLVNNKLPLWFIYIYKLRSNYCCVWMTFSLLLSRLCAAQIAFPNLLSLSQTSQMRFYWISCDSSRVMTWCSMWVECAGNFKLSVWTRAWEPMYTCIKNIR